MAAARLPTTRQRAEASIPITGMTCASRFIRVENAVREVDDVDHVAVNLALTGESLPVTKRAGETVFGATINGAGSFGFAATTVGRDATLAQIMLLVEGAQGSKAPMQRLAETVSARFAPLVLERARKIDAIVLDRTGALTRGKPLVTEIFPAPGSAPINRSLPRLRWKWRWSIFWARRSSRWRTPAVSNVVP